MDSLRAVSPMTLPGSPALSSSCLTVNIVPYLARRHAVARPRLPRHPLTNLNAGLLFFHHFVVVIGSPRFYSSLFTSYLRKHSFSTWKVHGFPTKNLSR